MWTHEDAMEVRVINNNDPIGKHTLSTLCTA
jgi:hypothetical protein